MFDTHIDLLIRIGPRDGAGEAYPVEALLDDGSVFEGSVLRLEREALLAAEFDPQAYGLELFYALFEGPVRRGYDRALGRAAAETEGRVRVRLWIDPAAAELHALPWERLYHPHRGREVPLAASTLTPFSRYTSLEIPEQAPLARRPLALLLALSNPADLPAGLASIDVDRETGHLMEALAPLGGDQELQISLLPGRTGLSPPVRARWEERGVLIEEGPTTLEALLRAAAGCDLLHFVGHGHFRRAAERGEGEAALYLEEEGGGWRAVRDAELADRLAALDPLPHLIFLAACESAARAPEHPFMGLAPRLVRMGVPAVIAMQEAVPADLARDLAGHFYRQLLEHGVVDRALNQARALILERGSTQWAIPALFMRLTEGRLSVPDPYRAVLRAIRAHRELHPWEEREYLPMEVVHLKGLQEAHSLERMASEPASVLDVIEAVLGLFEDAVAEAGPASPRLVALVGGHGTAKSSSLRRLAWITADRALRQDGGGQRVIPVYVDLTAWPTLAVGPHGLIDLLLLESLRPFWPDLTPAALADLLGADRGPLLRVLLDGGDDLPDGQRLQVWRALQEWMRRHPRHQCLLAVDPHAFDPRRLPQATDLLALQPLSQRAIERYLKGTRCPHARRLCDELGRRQLFDLASIPWLLARMLQRARRGLDPLSRAEVLASLIEDALAELPGDQGMRARAPQTLDALGRTMQWTRGREMTVGQAFRIMDEVRGNREYSLEALYDALTRRELLARIGEDRLRFAYPSLQAYCCARALLALEDRDQLLADIAATLGRPTRMRWWEETLVLLSGLMDDPTPLLRLIVYDASLAEGEQVFLAARCLLEVEPDRISARLLHQILSALVWRLDSANEQRPGHRARACQALGWLRDAAVIPPLARVANRPIRTNWRGQSDFEHSSVRMAAALALKGMMPAALEPLRQVDHCLAQLLSAWEGENVDALTAWLRSQESGAQALAAFALGELRTPPAIETLIAAFLDPATPAATRWAVTDALTLLDAGVVGRRAILPLLTPGAAGGPQAASLPRHRARWYEKLAYLIGRVRVQEPAAREFLERCLYRFTGIALKARAIQALGRLYDRRYKDLCETIALGDLSQLALPARLADEDALYLRRTALEALASLGDARTLDRLYAYRAGWPEELDRPFYWTSEEINWRLSMEQE